MRAGLGLALALPLAALLAGCAAQPEGAGGPVVARPGLDVVLARLPQEAAGFTRGMTTDLEATRPGQGRAVDYATPARAGLAARAAIATVLVYDKGLPPLAPELPAATVSAQLDEGVAEALAPAPGRQMAEAGRRALDVPGGAPLQCATLDGTYGRTAMWQQLCVGVAAGRFLKVFIAVPARQRDLLDMDADGFTRAIAQGARNTGGVAGR